MTAHCFSTHECTQYSDSMLNSDEHFEECILGITETSVYIYYTHESRPFFLPHISMWREAVTFEVLASEMEDVNAVELFKIHSFVEIMKDHK